MFSTTETPPIRRKSLNLDKIPEGEEGEEDEEEEIEESHKSAISPPLRVELLKQFVEGNVYTIAIKWELPQYLPQDAQGYNISVNGDVKMFVRNPLETTVMLSDIPRHMVCVVCALNRTFACVCGPWECLEWLLHGNICIAFLRE